MSGSRRRGQGGARAFGARAWPRCASSAAPRSAQGAGSGDRRLSGIRGRASCLPRRSTPMAGLFEPLLDEKDAIVSDSLNHASIIDGVRLCKAKRYRFANSDMAALEVPERGRGGGRPHHRDRHRRRLFDGRAYRRSAGHHEPGRAIRRAGDGRRLPRHRLPGPEGARLGRLRGVEGKIDFLTGTFGKALGGAMGGFVARAGRWWRCCASGRGPICFPMRWRRPSAARRWKRSASPSRRRAMSCAATVRQRRPLPRRHGGAPASSLLPGEHPIVPVMLGDARWRRRWPRGCWTKAYMSSAFPSRWCPRARPASARSFPRRIGRTDIDQAIAAFTKVRDAAAE